GERVFGSIADTKTPQGIIIIAARPETSRQAFESRLGLTPLLIIVHRVNNPANLGGILRSAEAASGDGAILTKGTTDPFSPKALRGSMGSSFRTAVWAGVSYGEALGWCAKLGIQTVSTDPLASMSYTDIDWKKPSALIVGAESSGLDPEEVGRAD